MSVERTLERVRKLCLRLPRVSERLSHGAPTFFIDEKKSFVTFVNDHHGDGRLGLWCAAPEGAQAVLVAADPERYFRPAYVGGRGWVGVRLDGTPDWKAVTAIINDAYDAVAPPRASNPKKLVTGK
ncbi:MAG: MmcQ/YjbR family DNA-binding protein [Candidatus Velthaea sp.]